MEQKQIGVVTFFSSQHAIRAEETLKEKGYEVSLMAGPKEISPNCGVTLQFQAPVQGRSREHTQRKGCFQADTPLHP